MKEDSATKGIKGTVEKSLKIIIKILSILQNEENDKANFETYISEVNIVISLSNFFYNLFSAFRDA
jgi:hypothetical protein